MAKDLPAPEIEKLMLTHLQVTDDDLRILAGQRAQDVKDHLTKAGVGADRAFVVEPKMLAPDKKNNLKNSRVDFAIR